MGLLLDREAAVQGHYAAQITHEIVRNATDVVCVIAINVAMQGRGHWRASSKFIAA